MFRLKPGFDFIFISVVHFIAPQCAVGAEVPDADVYLLLHFSGSSVWRNGLWGGNRDIWKGNSDGFHLPFGGVGADLFDVKVWSAEYS